MRIKPLTCQARRTGAAIIEFAAVVPVLLLFVMGIVEYGRLVMVAQVTTGASREGARYAVQADATPSAVDQYVRTYLTQSSIPAQAVTTVAIEYRVPAGNTAYTPENQGWVPATGLTALTPGTAVRVRVEVSYRAVSWLPNGVLLPSGTQLKGTTIMRKE